MKRIYKHVVINVAEQDVGCSIDLDQIVAVGPIVRLSFTVTTKNGKAVEVVALRDEQREALIAAWEAWIEQEARKV